MHCSGLVSTPCSLLFFKLPIINLLLKTVLLLHLSDSFVHVNCHCFMFLRSMMQCWCGPDRSVHHTQYRAGADALRGSGGHLPDGQNAENPAASHGAD